MCGRFAMNKDVDDLVREYVAEGGNARRVRRGARPDAGVPDAGPWDDWLNPASLTVDGDAAASKTNQFQLLDELDANSSAIALTIRTHASEQLEERQPLRPGSHRTDRRIVAVGVQDPKNTSIDVDPPATRTGAGSPI
ncbi:hypothetical protein J7E29_16795 [Streptomyces sp. ISL-90]|nr:hypothetical protein [Streptomyces sp. ISL-90]